MTAGAAGGSLVIDADPTLHVIEVADGLGEPLLAYVAEVGAALGVRPRVAIVGPAKSAELAAGYGCIVAAQHCPTLRDPALAIRSTRAMVRAANGGERCGERDVVVWGSSELAALLIGVSRGFTWVVVGNVTRLPGILARRLGGVQTFGIELSDEHLARLGGWFDGLIVRSVGAGLADAAPRAPREDRCSLRRRWGADDETLVVGVFGPTPSSTDFRRASDVVGIAAVRGARVMLVGHPASARAARSLRWMAEVGLDRMPLVLDQRLAEPWEVADALDLGLILGDGARTAGADVSRRRGGSMLAVASRWVGLGDSIVAQPHLAPLWLSRAGVPMVCERSSADPDDPMSFDVDNPLRATRAILALAARRSSLDRERTRSRERSALSATDPAWGRLFGVGRSVVGG